MISTLTVTGRLTQISMLFNNWITNITSFMASKSATHSASELDKVMLYCGYIFITPVHLKCIAQSHLH